MGLDCIMLELFTVTNIKQTELKYKKHSIVNNSNIYDAVVNQSINDLLIIKFQ